MKIHLKLIGRFSQLFQIDEKEIEMDSGATVLELLNSICNTNELRKTIFNHSEKSLRPNVMIRVNGRFLIHLNWLDTILEEGNRVEILTFHSGG